MTTDNQPTATILERVRKLLAQANGDGVTPAEAEAFASKAAELMARHGVEQAMLDAHRNPADDPVEHKRINLDRPYPHERGLLLDGIGHTLSVAVYWNDRRATMIGRRSDIERAELTFTALLLFAAGPLTAAVDTSWCYDSREAAAETRRYRKSWLTGFSARIKSRMRDAHRQAVEETREPGAALVLADRFAVAQATARELFPKAGTHKARKIDGYAYAQGARAAERADIGQTSVAGPRRALDGAR